MKKRQFEEAHAIVTNCEEEYFTKGLLYYDNAKRSLLLEEAEKLCYSPVIISRLKKFTAGNWNHDTVTVEDIKDFVSIENYVHENTPAWKKSIFFSYRKFYQYSRVRCFYDD